MVGRCTRLGLALLLLSSLAQADEPRKPNVLLIYADDMGYGELGCYGNKVVPTPNIDRIATDGVRCTQGYVSAPLCSPSRAGLMTGRYPTRFGHENNTMGPNGRLPLNEVTLAQRMKSIGYATSIVGKWHLGPQPQALPMARGFDEYYGVRGNPGSYFKPKRFHRLDDLGDGQAGDGPRLLHHRRLRRSRRRLDRGAQGAALASSTCRSTRSTPRSKRPRSTASGSLTCPTRGTGPSPRCSRPLMTASAGS